MSIEAHPTDQHSGLSSSQLLAVFRWMLMTRELDNRVRTLYLQGKISGGVYSQIGHEAISVGSAYALEAWDIVAPMHRDLGAHLVRGMDPGRIVAQIMARAAGYSAGKDNALHIGDLERRVLPQISMLGTSIPVAAGAALAARQRGESSIALTYVGDGAINTGDFHEGLNFAAALRLPLVLIVENNQYAYSTPLSGQIACDEIVQRSAGYGVPGVRVDGNDVLAVYRTVVEAVQWARSGKGPTLIECVTMRMRGHSEQDDASYVPAEMLAEWRRKDPIDRFEARLLKAGIIDGDRRASLQRAVADEVAQAAEWADLQPLPDPETALNGVYSPASERE
ncbi:MAG: thiamine pyrophosphate-dependent dehydrogenase E1 component subunit alpha [Chloroflexota bacterium]